MNMDAPSTHTQTYIHLFNHTQTHTCIHTYSDNIHYPKLSFHYNQTVIRCSPW